MVLKLIIINSYNFMETRGTMVGQPGMCAMAHFILKMRVPWRTYIRHEVLALGHKEGLVGLSFGSRHSPVRRPAVTMDSKGQDYRLSHKRN